MRAPFAVALGFASTLLAGCIGTARSQCAFDSDCDAAQVCTAGACEEGSRESDGGVCPTLRISFADIDQRVFQVGCGVKDNNCHSPGAVLAASGLDLSGDPYARLVGVAAKNLFGSCRCEGCAATVGGVCPDGKLELVKPGDSADSFLVIKLRALSADEEKLYGSAMPADHPGETCAAAQAAIAQWIDQGAGNN